MYVFKSLNEQDIITSPWEVNKSYSFNGDFELTQSNVGITRDIVNPGESKYNSIKQLYYSNYIYGMGGQVSKANLVENNLDGTTTGSIYSTLYDNFLSTTLNPRRELPSEKNIGLISIPKKLYGDHISPNSFSINTSNFTAQDNGEGIMIVKSNGLEFPVGNIIYEHGIVIFYPITSTPINTGSLETTYFYSNGVYGNTLYGESSSIPTYQFTIDDIHQVITNPDITLNMSSSYTLYETQYKCTVEETEFNVSQNTTLLKNNPKEIQLENQGEPSITVIKNEKDEDGTLKSFATSSFFNPYVTTVGLYNDAYELLAVAKLSQPLPTSHFNNMNIIVKMDQL